MKTPKAKFKFKLTEYVGIHIIKLYVIVLVAIVLLAVMLIVSVKFYRYRVYQDALKKPLLYSEQDISSILKSPGLTDFIIPESLESGGVGFTLYREPQKFWSNEMVEHYIIPPDELGVDQISLESKKIIEQKLEHIP